MNVPAPSLPFSAGQRVQQSRARAVTAVATLLLYAAVGIDLFRRWPLPGVVAVLAACWLASRSARDALREPWFRCGRVSRELPWLMVATIGVTAATPVSWQRLFDGRLPREYVEAAAGRPFWLLFLGGAVFSLVNAVVKEAVFRGVLQTALERVSGPVLAVVDQAVACGLLHVVCVPTVILGAITAGTCRGAASGAAGRGLARGRWRQPSGDWPPG